MPDRSPSPCIVFAGSKVLKESGCDLLVSSFPDETVTCEGFCRSCGKVHALHAGPAHQQAQILMQKIESAGRIDIDVPTSEADPRFSLDYLWGDALGQMFGVLAYRDASGNRGMLKAFSCQYNGSWLVEGWVPPVFSPAQFDDFVQPVDVRIKLLGRDIEHLRIECENSGKPQEPLLAELIRERKELSRSLMEKIHSLYALANFEGEVKKLRDVFLRNGLPAGAGDCCAPKLLQYAAVHGLTPLGLVEFFVGKSNRSGTRHHGWMYPACQEKCQPLLGHMLCGLEAL